MHRSHRSRATPAFITIDNPPANTWTPEGLRALETLVGELNADRDVYAAVITGAGEKFFSAGADLKSFAAATRCSRATSSPASARRSRR